jgi:H+/Cl- antiporter ClcA
MNRLLIVLIFWLLGFIGGVIGYFILPLISNFFKSFIPNLLSTFFLDALLAGIIGSVISTVAILFWASRSAKEF